MDTEHSAIVSKPTELNETYSAQVQAVLDSNKNKAHVVCAKCGSTVLRSGDARITKKQVQLPEMHKKSEQGDFPLEDMDEFWVVNDMYTFENVGFSNTIGTTKYLVCADCEEGPIGIHDTLVKDAFYVAASRVGYSVAN